MQKTRLGMLTPSSNTIVEPATTAIVQAVPGASAHFSRLRVTEISLAEHALAQFDLAPFLGAAELLADARMHVIAWNGTSSAWKGFDQDTALCSAITGRFGLPATTSMHALNLILRATGAMRFGLVTPYLDDVQSKIVENYATEGFEVVAERHSGISVNFEFSQIPGEDIATMVRNVALEKPDAIIIVCTNLDSPGLVEDLERELGIPVYDSLSAVVWHSLRLASVDTSAIAGWGSLFGAGIV